jgi:predicted PurR-regulated permease PerM
MANSKKDGLPLKNAYSSWEERRDIVLTILGWFAIIFISFWLLGHFGNTLFLLIIAIFLAYALIPAVDFFGRFTPRFLAITIVYLLLFVALGIFFYLVISTAFQEFMIFAHNINTLLTPKGHEKISPLLLTLKKFGISQQQLSLIAEQLTGYVENFASSILPFISSIVTTISNIFLIIVLSIYLLVDGKRIFTLVSKNIPTIHEEKIHFLFITLQRVVGGYIRGQLLLSLTIGLFVGIGMAILQVPYPILLGVLAFILEFIPMLGIIITGALCVLFALLKGWLIAVIALIYFIIVCQIEGNILGPRIVGKTVGLSPLISILALLAGAELYGLKGALFAAPVAGVGQALAIALWSNWKSTHTEDFLKQKHK